MLNCGFFKRVIPFFLTFALGLFIASFFVSITPEFQLKRKRPPRCPKEVQMLRIENDRLYLENQQLKDRLDAIQNTPLLEAPVAPPPVAPVIIQMPADSVPTAPRAK